MRVIRNKYAQTSFIDEIRDVDWDDGYGQPGVINDQNYEDFLADEREKEEAENYDPEVGLRPDYVPEQGIPNIRKVIYDANSGKTPLDLVYDGIDNQEVIEFGYTTREGRDAGYRRVEPHYTFIAHTTGNEVLVTHDLTPGIDESKGRIRAFIVGNIHPSGVRYQGDIFEPRPEIMVGIS